VFLNIICLDSTTGADSNTLVSTSKSRMSYEIGEWVLVKYDSVVFPGEVKVIGDNELKVSVMVPSGAHFKWPAVEDSIYYPMQNVIRKLQPPILKSARGTFEFFEKW